MGLPTGFDQAVDVSVEHLPERGCVRFGGESLGKVDRVDGLETDTVDSYSGLHEVDLGYCGNSVPGRRPLAAGIVVHNLPCHDQHAGDIHLCLVRSPILGCSYRYVLIETIRDEGG